MKSRSFWVLKNVFSLSLCDCERRKEWANDTTQFSTLQQQANTLTEQVRISRTGMTIRFPNDFQQEDIASETLES